MVARRIGHRGLGLLRFGPGRRSRRSSAIYTRLRAPDGEGGPRGGRRPRHGPGLCCIFQFRPVPAGEAPALPQEVQEPGAQGCRLVQEHLRFRPAPAGLRPPAPGGPRQHLFHLDGGNELHAPRLLQPDVPRGGHILGHGRPVRPGVCHGPRGLPRVPPSPPEVPPVQPPSP